jgi:hypothetical protein
MKAEETITTIIRGGAGVSPLGSHAFLDEFARAYHCAAAGIYGVLSGSVIERAREIGFLAWQRRV